MSIWSDFRKERLSNNADRARMDELIRRAGVDPDAWDAEQALNAMWHLHGFVDPADSKSAARTIELIDTAAGDFYFEVPLPSAPAFPAGPSWALRTLWAARLSRASAGGRTDNPPRWTEKVEPVPPGIFLPGGLDFLNHLVLNHSAILEALEALGGEISSRLVRSYSDLIRHDEKTGVPKTFGDLVIQNDPLLWAYAAVTREGKKASDAPGEFLFYALVFDTCYLLDEAPRNLDHPADVFAHKLAELWNVKAASKPTIVLLDFEGVLDTPELAMELFGDLEKSHRRNRIEYSTFGSFDRRIIETLSAGHHLGYRGDLSLYKYADKTKSSFAPVEVLAEGFRKLRLDPHLQNIVILDDRADKLAEHLRNSELGNVICVKVKPGKDGKESSVRNDVRKILDQLDSAHAVDGADDAGFDAVGHLIRFLELGDPDPHGIRLDPTTGRRVEVGSHQGRNGPVGTIKRFMEVLEPITEEDFQLSILQHLPTLPPGGIMLFHFVEGDSMQNEALAVKRPDGEIVVTINNWGTAQTKAFQALHDIMTALGFNESHRNPAVPLFFIGNAGSARRFYAFLRDGILTLTPEWDDVLIDKEVEVLVERAPSGALSPHVRKIVFVVGDQVHFELTVDPQGRVVRPDRAQARVDDIMRSAHSMPANGGAALDPVVIPTEANPAETPRDGNLEQAKAFAAENLKDPAVFDYLEAHGDDLAAQLADDALGSFEENLMDLDRVEAAKLLLPDSGISNGKKLVLMAAAQVAKGMRERESADAEKLVDEVVSKIIPSKAGFASRAHGWHQPRYASLGSGVWLSSAARMPAANNGMHYVSLFRGK